jgi:hypothetical protein
MRVSDQTGKRPSVRRRTDADRDLSPPERRKAFLARLARMSSLERLRAARFEFDRWERTVWAGRYPEEVPLVNGELEWIALSVADLD